MTRAISPLALLTRRFRKDRSGAAALEFAIVAFPFFALMFMIFEVTLSFFLSQILVTATSNAARKIMTGQVQSANETAAQFKQDICDQLPALFNCASEVIVDVRKYDQFAGADLTKIYPGGGITPVFDPGGPGDIIIVRVAYPMPVYTNFYGASLADMAGNKMLLMATTASKNEPFHNN